MKMSIKNDSIVKVTKMNNFTEIMFSELKGKSGPVSRVDKDHYANRETGELYEIPPNRKGKTRKSNKKSLYNTLKKDKEIMFTNFNSSQDSLFVTLTYYKPEKKIDNLNKDIKAYVKKLRCHYPDFVIKYSVAIEIGADRSYHCHFLFYFDKAAPDIKKELWTKGEAYITQIKKNEDIKNIVAYLTSHLCDMSEEEYKLAFPTRDVDKIATYKCVDGDFNKKKCVKNARLELYPENFRIIRHSKSLKRATKEYKTYKEALEEIQINGDIPINFAENDKSFGNVSVYQEFELYMNKELK